MTRVCSIIIIVYIAFSSTACAPHTTAPVLTPVAQKVFNASEVQHVLDLVRDIAQDANANDNTIVTDSVALAITNWHEAAVTALYACTTGTCAQGSLTALTLIAQTLTPAQHAALDPYVTLASAALKGFTP